MAPRSIIARGSTARAVVSSLFVHSGPPARSSIRPPSGRVNDKSDIGTRDALEKHEIAPPRVTRTSSRVNHRLENAIIAYVPRSLPTVPPPPPPALCVGFESLSDVQINLLLMISSLDDRRPTNASIRNDKDRSRVGRIARSARGRDRRHRVATFFTHKS